MIYALLWLLPITDPVGIKLDRFLSDEELFPGGFSGCVIVASQGEVLLEKAYGIADANRGRPVRATDLWDWASAAKQFTAAAILKLEMQGKLGLSDSLVEHFPNGPEDLSPITIHHLLSHTSGLTTPSPEGLDLHDREAVLERLLNAPISTDPGTQWKYSNTSYMILAGLVEVASGMSFETYLHKYLFEPASMKTAVLLGESTLISECVPREEWGRGRQFPDGERLSWAYRGAGGVFASVHDMYLWDQALRSDLVLSQTARKKFYTIVANDYALGWRVRQEGNQTEVYHAGSVGKFVTIFLRRLEQDVVIAIAYNCPAISDPEWIARDLAEIAVTSR
jgi:CubicO group peptidase (beta-lactamase class C family)